MGLEDDIEQVLNYLEWVPRDAFKQTDFTQGGWSGQFGARSRM